MDIIRKQICYIIILSAFFMSCEKDHIITPYYLSVPDSFPPMDIPSTNQITEESVKLGKMLFYDTRLSVDSTISCGSCHKAQNAFADNVSISPGVKGRLGIRNSPSLANVGYRTLINFDGGVTKLETQPNVPIEDVNEMDFHILRIVERLKNDKTYSELAEWAYDRSLDAYVISRSLASFLRTFTSSDSKYDEYLTGKLALSQIEEEGRELFFSTKAQCSSCHAGFNMTLDRFENNGLLETYTDLGRYLITVDDSDRYKYRTPSLRNIELTAPYMHNGKISSLEEVLALYGQGGINDEHSNPIIKSISLTSDEQSKIISFLHTLTDNFFITNPNLIE